MAAIFTSGLRRSVADAVFNEIATRSSRYFYYVGKTLDFDTPGETPGDNVDYESKIRREIIALKEVLPSDVCFVVPRFDWVSDFYYASYDAAETASASYVYVEDNFSIYICLEAGSGVSNQKPIHTTVSPVTYSDGYTWKYIYTIPQAMRDKFLTEEWIPVSNSLNESFFSDGGVTGVIILDSGEGYDPENTTISVAPESIEVTGAGANLTPVVENGKIINVIIEEPGSGYNNPIVTVHGPGATREAVISIVLSSRDIRSTQSVVQALATPGTIETITVEDGGEGYSPSTTLTIIGDGTGATATFDIVDGVIENVQVTNRGSGYTYADVVVEDLDLVGGSGFSGRANFSPFLGFGRDVVSDLNATTLMISSSFSRERISGVPFDNDIRQFGLIRNPRTPSGGVYPRERVTIGNYVAMIPSDSVDEFPVGTIIYNEFPTTINTKTFIIEETIAGSDTVGLRIRALDGGQIQSNLTYYKDGVNSFTVSSVSRDYKLDKRMVSGCYTLGTSSPNFFDINIFTPDEILYKSGKRFVIISCTPEKMIVLPIDGDTINPFDVLSLETNEAISPETVISPLFDKRTGEILTVDNRDSFRPSQTQSISLRTVIKF